MISGGRPPLGRPQSAVSLNRQENPRQKVKKLDLRPVTAGRASEYAGANNPHKSFLTLPPSSRASSRVSTARSPSGLAPGGASARISRRYRFDELGTPLDKLLPHTTHFDVVTQQDENALAVPSKRDYLRIYYSDYLSQKPPAVEDKPTFADPDKRYPSPVKPVTTACYALGENSAQFSLVLD